MRDSHEMKASLSALKDCIRSKAETDVLAASRSVPTMCLDQGVEASLRSHCNAHW